MLLGTSLQSQRSGLPERGPCPALDQPARRLPLPECDRIGQRRPAADDSPGGFDVGAEVEQSIEHRDIVAARGPVERRFRVAADKPRVDVGAGLDQRRHGRRAVRKVAGPVGGHVQQRARRPDPRSRQAGILREQAPQPFEIAALDGLNDRDGERLVRIDQHHDQPRQSALLSVIHMARDRGCSGHTSSRSSSGSDPSFR